ncbi:uncharacterized protein LOC107847573 [Capsicum annuum]|uniref:uncharacterized protein LOC107847573 n=1 Tax=Capsicum annuum TaxID=4072 RepID=UPI0007BF8238|nr:uncharacterized protein LOC107847573 [Capsicum annuum]XP_016547397.1 uncharacterized protein LOC107847573 [Capsicum annuum]XP_016547398.1 uncharacterized protein LOC107847573 [Capsicum annuum]XP_016547400.1 uncharacterized protein LOC107847573 [Capsicum annuum]XP_047254836.1 uncharacterized protein LOC107847573 [Capsicum annuum]
MQKSPKIPNIHCYMLQKSKFKFMIEPVNLKHFDSETSLIKLFPFASDHFALTFQGKIIFAAPLCPLVLQQVEALHEFVDIPQGTAVNIIVGSYVWFEDPDVASVDGLVEKISNGKADIERTDGKKVVR